MLLFKSKEVTVKDYLIVYQVRSEKFGIGQGNAYIHDFPLTEKAIEALLEKLLKETQELDPTVNQTLILNIVPLEKETEGVVEY